MVCRCNQLPLQPAALARSAGLRTVLAIDFLWEGHRVLRRLPWFWAAGPESFWPTCAYLCPQASDPARAIGSCPFPAGLAGRRTPVLVQASTVAPEADVCLLAAGVCRSACSLFRRPLSDTGS